MKRVGLLAGAAALTLTGGSFADTDLEAQNEELRARITDLESRLATVEAQENESWLTEQRASEVRSLVQDVLADADTRSSLLAQGMTAGYDNGAVIASADGNWLLRTNLHMQQRFVLGVRDDGDTDIDEDRWSFENTRTKFILSGNVVSPEWFYVVDINVGTAEVFDDDVGSLSSGILDREDVGNAYLGYDFGNGWKLQGGSMKAPLLREDLVDARYQLAVERSFVNYLYTGGYVDGIMLDYMGDQFHVAASYNDGADTGQTLWTTPDNDFAFTVRGEWLAMGTWEQFTDFTSPQGEETGLMIGGAIHYQTGEDDTVFEDLDILVLTGDVSWEFGGGNVFAALIYSDFDTPGGISDFSPLAIVIHGGYYLAETWEIFGRYEWSDFDISGADDINIFTIGFNKYFAEHNAKATVDLGVAFDPILGGATVGDEFASPITGWRQDAGDEDGQVILRGQMQIVF
jgi:hypothetical protein